MNCLPFEEKIARYIDGALDGSDARQVEQHLRSCDRCAEFADRLEYDRILLRTPPPECAEIDFAGLRSEIRRGIIQERRPNKLLPALPIAASILLAVGVAAIWLRPGRVVQLPPQIAPVKVEQSGTDDRVSSSVRPPRGPRAGRQTTKNDRLSHHPIPQADPALEAALREFLAAEEAPPVTTSPVSPVAIRIVTGNPNVVLILLQETDGVSNE